MEEKYSKTEESIDSTPESVQETADAQAQNDRINGEDAVEKLRTDVEEWKDKYIRLLAEFENYKRRSAKERLELIATAGKEIIVNLLEVLDDMDRAERQMAQTADVVQISEGNRLVFAKMRNILHQKGLRAMDSIGTDFDIEKHEAITKIEAGEEMKDKVVDELEKGYCLNEKIIRFAKVVVGN